MADLFQYCKQLSPLDEQVVEELSKKITTRVVKKGDYLLKRGETCKHLFFINEGLLKSFSHKDDKEFVMRFFSENVLFSIFDSYLTQTPSRYWVMALENTTVTLISYETVEELCRKYHSMETFFRKLVSIATVKMMKRISEMLEENAGERYNQFVHENNTILQRISLGDLAKYLGITQQSLSRIRTPR